MLSCVLFDLDDTLCDSRGARERGIAAALAILPARDVARAEACYRRVEPTPARPGWQARTRSTTCRLARPTDRASRGSRTCRGPS